MTGSIAVLGAEINRRVRWRLPARKDGFEFTLVIIGEEHGVVREWHALRLCQPAGNQGGQRPLPFPLVGARRDTQQPRKSSDIAVVDDLTCRDLSPGAGEDSRDTPPRRIDHDLRDRISVAELDPEGTGEVRKSHRKRPDAALNGPDTLLLDMRDQHQRGRRKIGGRTAIGRIASKELAESHIRKVVPEGGPERAKGLDREEIARSAKTDPPRQRNRVRSRRINEAVLQDLEDPTAIRREPSITVGLTPAGEITNGTDAFPLVCMEVEARATPPVMPCDDGRWDKRQLIVELPAGRSKECLEDPFHREHGWPCVEVASTDFDASHLSPGLRLRLADDHPIASRRKPNGSRQPGHTGTDYHHGVFRRNGHLTLLWQLTYRLDVSILIYTLLS